MRSTDLNSFATGAARLTGLPGEEKPAEWSGRTVWIRAGICFVAMLAVLSLFSSGRFFLTVDGMVMYQEARMLVDTGEMFTPSETARALSSAEGGAVPYVKMGIDGRYHAKYGPGMPAVEAAVLMVLKAIAGPGSGEVNHRLWIVPAGLSAATAAACVVLVSNLGAGFSLSLLLGAVSLLATPLWGYAYSGFSEPLQAFCITASVASAFYRNSHGGHLSKALAGAFLALGILTKFTTVILLPWIGLYIVGRTQQNRIRAALSFTAPVAAGLLLLAWYNYHRFGSLLDFGYSPMEKFSTPLAEGLFGLILSFEKGIVWYAPVVVLVPAGLIAMRHRFAPEALLVAVLTAVTILLYSRWWAWHGGFSWGPRFIAPLCPILMVPLAFVFLRTAYRRLAIALALTGFLINATGVVIDQEGYLRILRDTAKAASAEAAPAVECCAPPRFSDISGRSWLAAAWSYGVVTGVPWNLNPVYRKPPWIGSHPHWLPKPPVMPVIGPRILRWLVRHPPAA